MTHSKQSAVTSSPETPDRVKKKRSYLAKLFGRRKKSRERKDETRRLALSFGGSDGNDQTDRRDNEWGTKKKDKGRKKKPVNKQEEQDSSFENGAKKKRGIFKRWGAKKTAEIGTVSVELSDTTSGLNTPDIISHEVRRGSITPQSAKHDKKKNSKSPTPNPNDNNNNASKGEASKEIILTLPRHENVTSTPRRELPRDNVRLDSFQYDSATVGRRPIRRKHASGGVGPGDGCFRRSRSFSDKLTSNATGTRFTNKQSAERESPEDVSVVKYAKMCRQSNHAMENFTKSAKTGNFLRWHSVGDIQRHIAKDKSAGAVDTDARKKELKKSGSAKDKKSVSLQDLTFQDVCGNGSQPPSVYERISRKYPRTSSGGQVSAEEKSSNKLKRPPHLRPIQKPRPSLDKALSRSEANIWANRRETQELNNCSILAFKKVSLPQSAKENVPLSPKRHSADVLDMTSSMACPYNGRNSSESRNTRHTRSTSDYGTLKDEVPFFYNMTGDALLGQSSPQHSTPGGYNHGDILYNHITPSDHAQKGTAQPRKLPYVSSGTDSLLRSAKSTGTLLNLTTDDSDISWAATPSVKKSVYEQRKPLPDYTHEVEALLCKLRSSLREKPPPLPPKSPRAQSEVRNSASNRNPSCYPPFLRRSHDSDSQFRAVSSSPHRALPVASQSDSRGAGVSRSRSRARSIAKRFNFSGSTENLASPLSVCTSSNWSTELDVPEGYCKMKSLALATTPNQPLIKDPHVVKRRHCPKPEGTTDYLHIGRENRPPTGGPQNGHISTGVKDCRTHNNMSYPTCNGYPEVGGTFYYGRRPVSTSYADRMPSENLFIHKVAHNTSPHQQSNCGKTEIGKRPKVFYALDV